MAGSRRRRIRWWGGIFRPVLAWLTACLIAALVMIFTYTLVDSVSWIARSFTGALLIVLATALAVAAVTLLPALLLVFLARRFHWTRGWVDVLLPAVLAVLLWGLFWASQYTMLADWWRGFLTGLTLAPAGLAGGLTYWLLAGRPVRA